MGNGTGNGERFKGSICFIAFGMDKSVDKCVSIFYKILNALLLGLK